MRPAPQDDPSEKGYALTGTVSKPELSGFAERRLGPIRYFTGGEGPPVVLVHGLGVRLVRLVVEDGLPYRTASWA